MSGTLWEMGRILEQRETPQALVRRALQELTNVVACCFVPLPGKGRRSQCPGPAPKPAHALWQDLGCGQYADQGTRDTSGQSSPSSMPQLFTKLLYRPSPFLTLTRCSQGSPALVVHQHKGHHSLSDGGLEVCRLVKSFAR